MIEHRQLCHEARTAVAEAFDGEDAHGFDRAIDTLAYRLELLASRIEVELDAAFVTGNMERVRALEEQEQKEVREVEAWLTDMMQEWDER
ncbi:hypothetical protein P8631_11515 (plasmid) [Guyparkeria sp. 1SP6A2]|nr:hypothetical protein [Guyparkeria sp. 1SP6A2]